MVAIREDSWLAYWLSLPWRCKLGRHVQHTESQYEDTGYSIVVVSSYAECSRCETFLGWRS